MNGRLSVIIAVLGAGHLACRPPQLRVPSEGDPVGAPPSFFSTPACADILSLDAVQDRLSLTVSERSGDVRSLGRLSLSEGTWTKLGEHRHPVYGGWTSLAVSVAPNGNAFAALYDWDAQERVQVLHAQAEGWSEVPFGLAPPSDHLTPPDILAFGEQQALLQLRELSQPIREHVFGFGDGAWSQLEPSSEGEQLRSFHRGPRGQLWRASPPAKGAGQLRIHEWNGADWVLVPLELEVAAPGRVVEIEHTDSEHFVLYDSTDILDAKGLRLQVYAGGSEGGALPALPAIIKRGLDLSVDSSGQPVVTFVSELEYLEEYAISAMRFEKGVWQPVLEARTSDGFPADAWATVAADVLYTARSVATEADDDAACALEVRKVDLSQLDPGD